jgi:hypothetical protein
MPEDTLVYLRCLGEGRHVFTLSMDPFREKLDQASVDKVRAARDAITEAIIEEYGRPSADEAEVGGLGKTSRRLRRDAEAS